MPSSLAGPAKEPASTGSISNTFAPESVEQSSSSEVARSKVLDVDDSEPCGSDRLLRLLCHRGLRNAATMAIRVSRKH